jgi:hypothetical protein
MKCSKCDFLDILDFPVTDGDRFCPQCGSEEKPKSTLLKRGDVFRMEDQNNPIVVDNVDDVFVWAWWGEHRRGFPIYAWRHNAQTRGIVPF